MPTTSQDILYVKDVETQATIGIEKWEQAIKQKISFDIEMVTDIQHAAQSDQISDTVNYQQVTARLIDFISHSKFQLLETLAQHCADLVLQEFKVPGLRLRISKPGIVPHSKDSGIIITRGSWPTNGGN